jgi:hypothetical protein
MPHCPAVAHGEGKIRADAITDLREALAGAFEDTQTVA